MTSTHKGDTRITLPLPVVYGGGIVREFPSVNWMAPDPARIPVAEAYIRTCKGVLSPERISAITNASKVYLTLKILRSGLYYVEVRNYDTGMCSKHCLELSITEKIGLRNPKVLEGFIAGDGFTLEELSQDADGCATHCRKAIGIGNELVVIKYSLLKSERKNKCSFSYTVTRGEETTRPVYRATEVKIHNQDELGRNQTTTHVTFIRKLPSGRETYATDSFEFVFGTDAKLEQVLGFSQSNHYNHDWQSVRLQAAMRKGSGKRVIHTPDWQITPWLLATFFGSVTINQRCQPAQILARLLDSAVKGKPVSIDRYLFFGQ